MLSNESAKGSAWNQMHGSEMDQNGSKCNGSKWKWTSQSSGASRSNRHLCLAAALIKWQAVEPGEFNMRRFISGRAVSCWKILSANFAPFSVRNIFHPHQTRFKIFQFWLLFLLKFSPATARISLNPHLHCELFGWSCWLKLLAEVVGCKLFWNLPNSLQTTPNSSAQSLFNKQNRVADREGQRVSGWWSFGRSLLVESFGGNFQETHW